MIIIIVRLRQTYIARFSVRKLLIQLLKNIYLLNGIKDIPVCYINLWKTFWNLWCYDQYDVSWNNKFNL